MNLCWGTVTKTFKSSCTRISLFMAELWILKIINRYLRHYSLSALILVNKRGFLSNWLPYDLLRNLPLSLRAWRFLLFLSDQRNLFLFLLRYIIINPKNSFRFIRCNWNSSLIRNLIRLTSHHHLTRFHIGFFDHPIF
jgi:hypothetical protein